VTKKKVQCFFETVTRAQHLQLIRQGVQQHWTSHREDPTWMCSDGIAVLVAADEWQAGDVGSQ